MIANTLYAKYIKEREGLDILENEHGFLIYKVMGPECFIVDMYVNNEQRRSGRGSNLVNELAGRLPECTMITANIWPHKPGSTAILAGALRLGFSVRRAEAGVILVAKDLMGEKDGEK